MKHTTTKEIEAIITSLKTKNSHVYDEISTKILNISRVLSTGVLPGRLKYSEIKHLFKKGDKTNISNYRPISLPTSFSKVIEKIIYKRVHDHININNILVKDEVGFKTNSSTEIATYTSINNIRSALANKLLVGSLFCDLQKAFDCLNHEILLSKIGFYGILGIVNNLIKSYLQDRYQRLLINIENSNKYLSEWEQVNYGVPQGPLFFLVCVNYLSKIISGKSNVVLFANDAIIFITNSNPLAFGKNINEVFRELNEWFQGNLLSLNYDKTYFLQFVSKKNQLIDTHISFGNKNITNDHSTKFLGLTIDTSFSWKYHIEELKYKLNKAWYAIRSIKPFMSLEVLRMTYFLCSFSSIIWYNILGEFVS